MIALTHALGHLKETSLIFNKQYKLSPSSHLQTLFGQQSIYKNELQEEGLSSWIVGRKKDNWCVCGSFFCDFNFRNMHQQTRQLHESTQSCSFNSTVLSQHVKVNLPVVKSAKQFRMSAWITYFPMYFQFSKCHLSNSAKEYEKKKKSKQIKMQQ